MLGGTTIAQESRIRPGKKWRFQKVIMMLVIMIISSSLTRYELRSYEYITGLLILWYVFAKESIVGYNGHYNVRITIQMKLENMSYTNKRLKS